MLEELLGWGYFICWSLSFWPQVLLNHKRKRVDGLSIDFVYLNLFGFACYATYNSAFFFSEEVKHEYRSRYGSDNSVRINDVAFALHALILCVITWIQTLIFPEIPDSTNDLRAVEDHVINSTAEGFSSHQPNFYKFTYSFIAISTTIALMMLLFSSYVIDVLYFLSFIKMTISLLKYIPQAFMNMRRKSTVGFSILNIQLDFSGGMLSIGQMLVQVFFSSDWTVITGNPSKLSLGLTSMCFDILFLVQHYWLYRDSHEYFLISNSEDFSISNDE